MNDNGIITVIGIDPGNNMGVSVFKLDGYTMEILNIETLFIDLNRCIDVTNIVSDRMTDRIMVINNFCTELHNIYKPSVIAVEAAFLNNRFPRAVMQLSQYIAAIEISFKVSNPLLNFLRYPPKYVKRMIGAGGNAKKDDMTTAIENIPEINDLVDTSLLTEHEIDALAIGYIGVQQIREAPYILYGI